MKKLILVVGARPNFMKVAPLIREIHYSFEQSIQFVLVHTGQHYDPEMSDTFFNELEIPAPSYNLEVGSATHSIQTAKVMERFEPLCLKENPDYVVVFGDVNSTLACTLVAVKNHIKVAHVEAGLRSFDRAMPEEINRLLTDQVSDCLFTPGAGADENLLKEGVDKKRIFRVGDIMVDALKWEIKRAVSSDILKRINLEKMQPYGVMTLHRAGNVDNRGTLSRLMKLAENISRRLPVVFPVHPRTAKRLKEFDLKYKTGVPEDGHKQSGIIFIKPVGYRDFLKLIMASSFALTDSGGLQKETTVLRVPCLTLRDTTEWTETVSKGTNTLLGSSPDPERVMELVENLLAAKKPPNVVLPEFWDGKTAYRILKVLDREVGR